MNEPLKTEQILARYEFSDAEIREIAVKMAATSKEHTRTQDELASVKADFKAKLEKIALDRDALTQRISDGFEMRPTLALVKLDDPSAGRKTYYYALPNFEEAGYFPGNPIREEAMTFADQQRDLSLTDDQLAQQAGVADTKIDGLAEQAADQPSDRHAEIGDTEREFEQTKDILTTAAQPIGTSLEQKLTEAAAGKTLPMVEVDFAEGYAPEHYILKFGKKAKQQGWPEACIQIIRGVCEATADKDVSVEAGVRVQQVLRAHSVPVPPKGATRTHGNLVELPKLEMQINSITLDSQERFMTELGRAMLAAEWPETAIETVGNIIREGTTVAEMHEAVKPYLAK